MTVRAHVCVRACVWGEKATQQVDYMSCFPVIPLLGWRLFSAGEFFSPPQNQEVTQTAAMDGRGGRGGAVNVEVRSCRSCHVTGLTPLRSNQKQVPGHAHRSQLRDAQGGIFYGFKSCESFGRTVKINFNCSDLQLIKHNHEIGRKGHVSFSCRQKDVIFPISPPSS